MKQAHTNAIRRSAKFLALIREQVEVTRNEITGADPIDPNARCLDRAARAIEQAIEQLNVAVKP